MKKIDLTQFDWLTIQKSHDSGINFSDICLLYNINATVLRRASIEGFFKRNDSIYRMSDKNRKIASDRMKHLRSCGIGNLQHKKSIPCETFKQLLRERNLIFVEEFLPIKGSLFRIDIAFPDKKIGIEVNGNQHYSAIGKLSDYYQQRHDLIEAEGWLLYELHYSQCFNQKFIANFLVELQNQLYI